MSTNIISYKRFSPEGENKELTGQLVECYRDVFATRPWNEWLRCEKCGQSWGKEDTTQLITQSFECCGSAVTDYWARKTVLADLRAEIKPESSCWLALDQGKVIGFCWGYPIELDKLEKKVGLDIDWAAVNGSKQSCIVAYQDEIGVRDDYRGRKIAKELFGRYIDDIRKTKAQLFLARTKRSPEPSVVYSWYTQKQNYGVVAAYPPPDGRVILGRRTNNIFVFG